MNSAVSAGFGIGEFRDLVTSYLKEAEPRAVE
jgi:hypothetical protein